MAKFTSKKTVFSIDQNTALTSQILIKLEQASICIGKLNQFSSNVFEFDFINEALKNIEALNSAKIEGTTGNLKDLYLKDSIDFAMKKKLKLFSAINYRISINELSRVCGDYKRIDIKLIRHLHKILTENDPATTGIPGKFREKDVKIDNSKLGDFYPAYHVKVSEFMDVFVKRINSEKLPKLISLAIAHYQFEAIHPFEDGNGRTGRLLINAKLLLDGLISEPVLNLSQYFEKHRENYISGLRSVSEELSYEEWVKFFLDGIIEQCRHNLDIIEKMRDIKSNNEALIRKNIVGSLVATNVLKYALNTLFFTIPDVSKYLISQDMKLSAPEATARLNVKKLEKMGIISEVPTKIGRARVYVHKELKEMLMG